MCIEFLALAKDICLAFTVVKRLEDIKLSEGFYYQFFLALKLRILKEVLRLERELMQQKNRNKVNKYEYLPYRPVCQSVRLSLHNA